MSNSNVGTLVRASIKPKVDAQRQAPVDAARPSDLAAESTAQPEAPATSRRRRPIRGERMAVYLPPELVEELRVRCARERRSMSDAVSEAVGLWALGRTGT